MEKNVDLNDLIGRSCYRIGNLIIANISIMGAAPTVVVFDHFSDLNDFATANPGVSITIMTVPYYGYKYSDKES